MPQIDIDGANSKISADTIQGQSGTTVTVTAGHNLAGSGSGLTALPAGNLTGTLPAISGVNLTSLNASNLGSGTVPTARLGSGTASSSTFLRGDQTYAAAGGGAWEHILTVDASNVANVDFDSGTATYTMSDYSYIVFLLKHVYGNTASQIPQILFSTNDGSSYLSDYQAGESSFDVDGLTENGGNTAGDSKCDLTSGDPLNSGAGGVNYAFSGELWQPSHQGTATRNQSIRWQCVYADGSGDTKQVNGFGFTADTIDSGGLDAWRFKMSSGNITGRFSMYGIKDS